AGPGREGGPAPRRPAAPRPPAASGTSDPPRPAERRGRAGLAHRTGRRVVGPGPTTRIVVRPAAGTQRARRPAGGDRRRDRGGALAALRGPDDDRSGRRPAAAARRVHA